MIVGALAILGAAEPWPALDPTVRAMEQRARDLWGAVRYNWRLAVSSGYGYRTHPVTGEVGSFHPGVDIPLPVGTPAIAVWPATVERLDREGEGRGAVNGNAVILRAGDWQFCYLHLSQIFVKVGQDVHLAQPIAHTGNSGRSTGPHLHFQVYFRGRPLDPGILYPSGLFT